ncbi:UNVERIFIED_CONTAM: arsenate reductase (glutaredoxin), partial [Salmonella enterica subsp. enterica serovar Weltevreden]
MSGITVYHNPKCSTSRGALELIRERGFEPHVVEYLKTPLSADALRALVA